jgi:hypothetical protein
MAEHSICTSDYERYREGFWKWLLLNKSVSQRLAMTGCVILVAYWYTVYRVTFETELGWNTMGPVTCFAGLSTFIGGYMSFLYHNRGVSFRSALHWTISRCQSKPYEARGFSLPLWEGVTEDGKAICKEIKAVASGYDVEWDERADERDEVVTKALTKQRKNGKEDKSQDNGEDDED